MLQLGTLGFGGPVAMVGHIHKDLVEQRQWITEEEYREGFALTQLAPDPLAAQLGIYLKYVHYKIKGATLCSLAFVFPSFTKVVLLGIGQCPVKYLGPAFQNFQIFHFLLQIVNYVPEI